MSWPEPPKIEKYPTVAFLPEAWHPSSAYASYFKALEKKGFTVVPIDYPSFNPKDTAAAAKASVETDAAAVREKLQDLVDKEERDVVVVTHGYGTLPGTAAVKGLSVRTRTDEEKKGGVIGLLYIAGFIIQPGESVVSTLGGNLPDFVQQDKPSKGLSTFAEGRDLFSDSFSGEKAPDGETQRKAFTSSVQPHAHSVLSSLQVAEPAFKDDAYRGRNAYMYTFRDTEVPMEAQRSMTQGRTNSVGFFIKMIDSGHMGAFGGKWLESSAVQLEELVNHWQHEMPHEKDARDQKIRDAEMAERAAELKKKQEEEAAQKAEEQNGDQAEDKPKVEEIEE